MMRFDMRAPGKTPSEIAELYRAAVEMAAWAEDKGCAAVVISEHHAVDDGYLPAPFLLAASMAAVTTTVPIAVAAALLPLYDPVRMAEEMIVLDHLSRGRVMHTLGLGYRPVEYELFGVDYDRRGAIADDKLATLLAHVRGTAPAPQVTPAPFTAGGPAIAWGGGTKAAARRAARFGLNFVAQTDVPGLAEAYEEASRAAGREPGACLLAPRAPTSVFVNNDLDAGWKEVGAALLADAVPYAEWNEAVGMADVTVSISRSRTVEDLRAENAFHRVVTVDEAVTLIKEHGILGLQPLCGGLEPATAWAYLRRVVDDVLPAVGASPI
jgi:alkanesulfonate monooxygenase SsuD/methylene tetrahydromethanopterin reductase-like flavin-dependent oxidoreductase (luciferase family)